MIPNVPYHRKRASRSYIDKDELKAEVQKCIDNDRTCSNKLGTWFCMIIEHMLEAPNFRDYSPMWKEQMKAFALQKLLKSMKSVDLSKCKNVFNYYSRTVYLAFVTMICRLKRELEKYQQLCSFTKDEQVDGIQRAGRYSNDSED